MRILHVSTADIMGGAERVAGDLCAAARAAGHDAWLAVGSRRGAGDGVVVIPNDASRGRWTRVWRLMAGPLRGAGRAMPAARPLRLLLESIGDPKRALERARGLEDFNFPGTWRLLDLLPQRPDVVHCHNLHGGYFDLRALPWLCRQQPVILTVHDTWLLSGHCAYTLGCERWKTGCGRCPHLAIYPAIPRDQTAFNWSRKREIYARSRLYLATPSRWAMDQVAQSMLAPAVVESRVIPNGIDLRVFRAGDRLAARRKLGLPAGARIVLAMAGSVAGHVFRDSAMMRAALAGAAERVDDLLIVAVGGAGGAQTLSQIGRARVRFVPFQENPQVLASYYQAADIYVHPSRADTFPLTVLEAMACGIPVVATAVDGIPEQVEDGRTGMLVPPGDSAALAATMIRVLDDEALRVRLGREAEAVAHRDYGLDACARGYLRWYDEILTGHGRSAGLEELRSAGG